VEFMSETIEKMTAISGGDVAMAHRPYISASSTAFQMAL
jgi:hypothetical protein